jgi:hypothetical protein
MAETTDAHEHRIRECASYLWEAEGRPAGRDNEFWHRASEQIIQDSIPAAPAKRKTRRTSAQATPKARTRNGVASPRVTTTAVMPPA